MTITFNEFHKSNSHIGMATFTCQSFFPHVCLHTCGSRSLLFYFRISYPDEFILIKICVNHSLIFIGFSHRFISVHSITMANLQFAGLGRSALGPAFLLGGMQQGTGVGSVAGGSLPPQFPRGRIASSTPGPTSSRQNCESR